MARSFKRTERLSALNTIDITPLIDLAFSLLIIFMISAPLLEQTIQVDMPLEDAKQQTPRPDTKMHVIGIDKAGQIYWGDKPVDMGRLNDLLGDAAREPDQPIISLRADRTLPFQSIVDVIDLIKQNGLTKLDIDTQAR